MAMDEFAVLSKARAFVRKVNATTPPAPIKAYLEAVNAKVKPDKSMGPDEAGSSFEVNGTHFISVNANDSGERQNFTLCHELAHIILGLPSDHDSSPWWSYAKRSPNEIACDVFAAELLAPYQLFKPIADAAQFGFKAINQLASQFEASLTATGSRFAAVVDAPCAFVLAERGKVRYAVSSIPLRDAKAWIPTGLALPVGSLSEKLRAGAAYTGPEEIAADLWFDNWTRGGELLEDARYFRPWDQILSLIWFDDEEVPPPPRSINLNPAVDPSSGGVPERVLPPTVVSAAARWPAIFTGSNRALLSRLPGLQHRAAPST